ncbi:hypothetical protein V6N13_140780 [Hibiscus sabdariffa]
MGRHLFLFACTLLLLAASTASAAGIVEHTFFVKSLTVSRLCKRQVITAVNGSLPGPTVHVQEGDTLIIHVFNESPYDLTIHWEVPIISGEWWKANVVDVDRLAAATGTPPKLSDAFTINGRPGDLYPCSKHKMYKLTVVQGKTYLLRIINAALNNQLFYKIANHMMTVVAIDANYVEPYVTDVVVTGPGQTVDVLLTADQPVGSYYMAARPYASATLSGNPVPFDNTTTRGVIVYDGCPTPATPLMPALPGFYDTPMANKFYNDLKGLVGGPFWNPVPLKVDYEMFITIGLALEACPANNGCKAPKLSASMNNESFVKPTSFSLLQAFYYNINGFYTTDFPSKPAIEFNYTNDAINKLPIQFAPKSTKITKLKFNTTVEIIFQNTNIIGPENHPMHLHGFNFHVLAQGFGNYNPATDRQKLNLINPQIRNTIGVPVGGWAVIRFVANNPGVWLLHCHLDMHLAVGLATAFLVENGPTPETTLPPPPADLPQC